jgi:hypothetical protein
MAKKEWKIGNATFRTPKELHARLVEMEESNGSLAAILRTVEASRDTWRRRAEHAEKRYAESHAHLADVRALLDLIRERGNG